MKSILKDGWVLFSLFFSFFLLILSIIIAVYNPQPPSLINIAILILSQTGACIFFPLLIGYFVDKFKEKRDGDILMQYFDELNDAGILRIYKHRKSGTQGFEDMKNRFASHKSGQIKIIGVTLKTFFYPYGYIYQHIVESLKNDKVTVKAMLCNEESPEVKNRGKIEDNNQGQEIRQEITMISNEIDKLKKQYKNLSYEKYYEAPYCTAIIFPDKCYFSPNILSKADPSNLPFIVLKNGSNGYERLDEYFDYIWKMNNHSVKRNP